MKYRAEDDAGEWEWEWEENEFGWADALCGGSDCADWGVW